MSPEWLPAGLSAPVFFISLGMNLDLGMLGAQVDAALVFSLFILAGNPLIVMIIMGVLGYRKRTGFLAGLTVAQISEFSLIFIAMGVSLGHLEPEVMGLVTLVGLITIALSVYMITYSHTLYRVLERFLGIFERRDPVRENGQQLEDSGKRRYDIILFGLGRFGSAIARQLHKNGYHLLLVDFNPGAVRTWRRQGYDAIYGDASDEEFIGGLPLEGQVGGFDGVTVRYGIDVRGSADGIAGYAWKTRFFRKDCRVDPTDKGERIARRAGCQQGVSAVL